MKKIICFMLLLGGWFAQAAAAGDADLLQRANQLYSEGEYRQAADAYEQLLQEQGVAPELYYNLGTYMGNCSYGGSNYEACIVTARNALLDFPYASPQRREDFSIMILRAKFHLAQQSVESKRLERYRDTIDEYYGFVNEYPESKYMKDAQRIFAQSEKVVNKK